MNKIKEHEEEVVKEFDEKFTPRDSLVPVKHIKMRKFLLSALSAHREVIQEGVKKELEKARSNYANSGEACAAIEDIKFATLSLLDTPKETI